MDLDKEVFTTFEAADICHANISSIKNWIDQGELDAFKTPGGHYRIPKKDLTEFLDRHEMPNPFVKRQNERILVIEPEQAVVQTLQLRLGDGYDYDTAADGVDALLKIGQWKPDVAVVDCRVEELDVPGLCARVEEFSDLGHVKVVVVYDADGQDEELFEETSAAAVVARQEGSERIVEVVGGLVG